MHPKRSPPSPKILFVTSSLPFLVGLLCDGLLCLANPNGSLEGLENQGNPILLLIRQAQELSYGVYSSFIHFLTAMLMVHLVIQILRLTPLSSENLEAQGKPQKVQSLLGYALAYTALYFFCAVLFSRTQVEETSSLKVLQNLEELQEEMREMESPSPSRILEEEISSSIEVKEERKIKTFPLGKVLGSINMDASSAIFSKDETVLYVSRANHFGVSVVDMTNWESPKGIQDYKLVTGINLPKASLLLSPDGKTLFASNTEDAASFELSFNVIVSYESSSEGSGRFKDSTANFETSLALSPDGSRLFLSGSEFQVIDTNKGVTVMPGEIELPKEGSHFSTMTIFCQDLFILNGTVLQIYDITDVDNRKLISSFQSENMLPRSFVQSKDGKILTVIGFEKGTTNKVVIEKVDISDVRAPFLTKTIPLNIESFSDLFGLSLSPKETYLYFTVKESNTSDETKMLVFDMLTERLLEDTQNLISKAKSLVFTSNENKMMVIYEESILALQLYRYSPNDRIFTIAKETFAQVPTVPKSLNKILKEFSSSNGKFLLNVAEMEDSTTRFTFTNILNHSSPIEINSFSGEKNIISASVTNDAKTLSVSFKSGIIVYDISNLKDIKILGSLIFEKSYEVEYPSFGPDFDEIIDAVFTSDGTTCFAAITSGPSEPLFREFSLKVFDLSDPGSIKVTDSSSKETNWGKPFQKRFLALSKDEKVLFVVNSYLSVFDVSARTVSQSYLVKKKIENEDFVPSSVSLSPDEKTLIIKKENLQSSSLHIFSVSDPATPRSRGVFALPKTKVIKNIPVGFSPDGSLAYVEGIHEGQPSLLVLDISDPSSPVLQSAIQTEGLASVDNFIISDDGRTVYLASNSEDKIYVTNLEATNTVYLGTENFRLGEKSSTDVMVLRQNDHGNYVPLGKNYRFVKASFFSTKIVPTEYSTESTFTAFPYWMSFERRTGNLVIEPKRQRELGTYTFYSMFSTQLNHSSFWTITNDTTQIRALLGSLVSLDYLDNQLYVTENFGTFDDFYYTGVESEKVYQILKDNCFETFTTFDIVPSLDLGFTGKKLEIQTPSYSQWKIEITLKDDGRSFQFLKKKYGALSPLITQDKTRLSLEGSPDDIKNALKNLVVNSEVNDKVSEGTITISDNLNPSISRNLKNLSSYFEFNEKPRENDEKGFSLQEQVNSAEFYTGKQFSLPLLKNTFIDKHSADNLRFTLTLDNKERSSVSDWLIFNDGVLKGTPKKEVMKRKVNLILTISNEFKNIEVPFTMNINLSVAFILELLMKYSPYILTVVSLWIFANRIYNVLKKDKYRHCKDFYLSGGQEISAQDLYPISFIGQEALESDLIWSHILMNKREELSKENIFEEIKKVVEKLPEKNLNLYHNGSDLSQKLIHQLIINNLALWLIDSKEEKETKKVYEENIKSEVINLVKWDDDNSGYCQINKSKLSQILNKEVKEEEGLGVGLIKKTVINVDLLKDVIITEAMRLQSVRTRATFTHLIIKEEVSANWLFRFLKRNLYDIQSVQGQKMAYGIEYGIKNDVLCFSGVAEEKFCGRTIVIQITDLRHKILKEVWIHGVKRKRNEYDERSELEVQGQKYEIL